MSDNVQLPGSGQIIATDDVSGVEFQKMKLDKGTDGTTTPVAEGYPLPTHDEQIVEVIASRSEFGESSDRRDSLIDILDLKNPDVLPLLTAPAGIDNTGQRLASQSFPVALATEQILDKYIIAKTSPPTSLGANALAPVENSGWLDCSQYRSIFFQTNTPAGCTVTLTFEGSNDGANAVAVAMFDIAAPTTAPVNNVAQAVSSQRFFGGPIQFKYFRARVSTGVSGGTLAAFTMLRMAPFYPIQTWAQSNVAQIAGTATVTTGVSGMQAVGGNIGDGVAPTAAPVLEAGQDNSGAITPSVTTVALPSVPVIATGLTRRLLTDTMGDLGVTTPIVPSGKPQQVANPVTVSGPMKGFVAGQYGPIRTMTDPNIVPDSSEPELLHQILLQLKMLTLYLKELPFSINQDTTRASVRDEPDDMLAEGSPETGGTLM